MTGRDLGWELESSAIRRWLAAVLDRDADERAARRARPAAVELLFGGESEHPAAEVGLPDGRRLRFKGAIDRVDRADDGSLLVIDYKTGKGLRLPRRRRRPPRPRPQAAAADLRRRRPPGPRRPTRPTAAGRGLLLVRRGGREEGLAGRAGGRRGAGAVRGRRGHRRRRHRGRRLPRQPGRGGVLRADPLRLLRLQPGVPEQPGRPLGGRAPRTRRSSATSSWPRGSCRDRCSTSPPTRPPGSASAPTSTGPCSSRPGPAPARRRPSWVGWPSWSSSGRVTAPRRAGRHHLHRGCGRRAAGPGPRAAGARRPSRLDLDDDERARVRGVLADVGRDHDHDPSRLRQPAPGRVPPRGRPAARLRGRGRDRGVGALRPAVAGPAWTTSTPNPGLREVLGRALVLGLPLRRLAEVARVFDDNWDRLGPPGGTPALRPVDVARGARAAGRRPRPTATHCIDPDDLLLRAPGERGRADPPGADPPGRGRRPRSPAHRPRPDRQAQLQQRQAGRCGRGHKPDVDRRARSRRGRPGGAHPRSTAARSSASWPIGCGPSPSTGPRTGAGGAWSPTTTSWSGPGTSSAPTPTCGWRWPVGTGTCSSTSSRTPIRCRSRSPPSWPPPTRARCRSAGRTSRSWRGSCSSSATRSSPSTGSGGPTSPSTPRPRTPSPPTRSGSPPTSARCPTCWRGSTRCSASSSPTTATPSRPTSTSRPTGRAPGSPAGRPRRRWPRRRISRSATSGTPSPTELAELIRRMRAEEWEVGRDRAAARSATTTSPSSSPRGPRSARSSGRWSPRASRTASRAARWSSRPTRSASCWRCWPPSTTPPTRWR